MYFRLKKEYRPIISLLVIEASEEEGSAWFRPIPRWGDSFKHEGEIHGPLAEQLSLAGSIAFASLAQAAYELHS